MYGLNKEEFRKKYVGKELYVRIRNKEEDRLFGAMASFHGYSWADGGSYTVKSMINYASSQKMNLLINLYHGKFILIEKHIRTSHISFVIDFDIFDAKTPETLNPWKFDWSSRRQRKYYIEGDTIRYVYLKYSRTHGKYYLTKSEAEKALDFINEISKHEIVLSTSNPCLLGVSSKGVEPNFKLEYTRKQPTVKYSERDVEIVTATYDIQHQPDREVLIVDLPRRGRIMGNVETESLREVIRIASKEIKFKK